MGKFFRCEQKAQETLEKENKFSQAPEHEGEDLTKFSEGTNPSFPSLLTNLISLMGEDIDKINKARDRLMRTRSFHQCKCQQMPASKLLIPVHRSTTSGIFECTN